MSGGSLAKGRQVTVGWSKMTIFASFAYYIFQTVTYNDGNYYTVIHSR